MQTTNFTEHTPSKRKICQSVGALGHLHRLPQKYLFGTKSERSLQFEYWRSRLSGQQTPYHTQETVRAELVHLDLDENMKEKYGGRVNRELALEHQIIRGQNEKKSRRTYSCGEVFVAISMDDISGFSAEENKRSTEVYNTAKPIGELVVTVSHLAVRNSFFSSVTYLPTATTYLHSGGCEHRWKRRCATAWKSRCYSKLRIVYKIWPLTILGPCLSRFSLKPVNGCFTLPARYSPRSSG